jgi:hypothetical protein
MTRIKIAAIPPKLEVDELRALAALTREIVVNAYPQDNHPIAIPRRRLQSIQLINEASELLDAAVINLANENAVEDEY